MYIYIIKFDLDLEKIKRKCYNNSIEVNMNQKVEKVRALLKKYVERGGNVNDLTKKDKEYIAVCNLEVLDKDGKRLSIADRFSLLGFERKPKREPFFEKAQKMVDEYVAKGGDINDLKPGDLVYDYIACNTIKKPEGGNLSLFEKFEKLGYKKNPMKEPSFDRAKKMLDEFVAKGGKIDDLKSTDPIYQFIVSSDIYLGGVLLKTMEERFSALGYPRKRKCAENVKDALIEEIDAYLANGGKFDIDHSKLPFFQRVHSYIKGFKKKGLSLTFEEAMKQLGYKQYSSIYFRCKDLSKLKEFRDENGYVDSFRKDKSFVGYMTFLSRTLEIPYSIIIQLLADEKLKTMTISTEYIAHVKDEFERHIEVYGTLKGFTSIDKKLYEKLHNLRRYISVGTGETFTNEEILSIMDLDVEHSLKNKTAKDFDLESVMSKFMGKGKIKSSDIDSPTYRWILTESVKMGVPMTELFNSYGIEYHGKNRDRLSKMYVHKMPYLKEMKARRDELLSKSEICQDKNACKEEIFEERVRVCKQVYGEFKEKIYNFSPDDIKEADEKTLGD